MESSTIDYGTLDQEWKELILSALELGINPEEIRQFLSNYPNVSTKFPELTK
ncbi:anti-repressor SinI family protein [Metabacillus herbersteinensis]|uniref:Anti-repressor SinI family protein n=1 Tax=Metabacillus herbersteinensis TaxID=283816 RepID=A0ABV6G8G0_9BACI